MMGLNISKPPAGARAIVSERLGALTTHGAPASEMLAETSSEQLDLAAPHPVYFIKLTDVAEGRLLSAAILTGWRYLVLQGEEAVGAATVAVLENNESLRFSHMSQGPFVKNTIEGIRHAEELPEVLENDYELRMLDIPSLYVVALWLHGQEDRIIPLAPTNRALDPYKTYSEDELLSALKEAALNRLEFEEKA
ncbi:MAG TPA: hypothetical protein VF089_15365 [Candidatus Binatia bacterium]